MTSLEDSLSQLLGDPKMMAQIMSLAQSLGQQAESAAPEERAQPSQIPDFSALAGAVSVDKEQQALLRALGPYISRERCGKLERAMRAAKMASLASEMLLRR